MQFFINRDTFLSGLMKVQGIVEKKHTIPILANVLIEAKNGEITLNISSLKSGQYILNFRSQDSINPIRFIKK